MSSYIPVFRKNNVMVLDVVLWAILGLALVARDGLLVLIAVCLIVTAAGLLLSNLLT